MEWTTSRVTEGSDELKRAVSLVLGGYLPGGVPIQKEGKKDADK